MSQKTDRATPIIGRLPHIPGGVILEPRAEPQAERKRRKKKLPKVISAVEAEALLKSIGEDAAVPNTVALRNRLMCELMYRAGLRVSEVVSLRPRDVERDGVIHLYDAKGGDGTAYFPADELASQMAAWYHQRRAWIDKLISSDHGSLSARLPLFIKPAGTPLSTRYVQRLVARHKALVGIHGIVTPHVFRHTFATQMLEEGFQLTEVQAALRHQNLQTTAVYLHVRDESLRRKMTGRTRRLGEEVNP